MNSICHLSNCEGMKSGRQEIPDMARWNLDPEIEIYEAVRCSNGENCCKIGVSIAKNKEKWEGSNKKANKSDIHEHEHKL
jgi:hypothetical protein